MKTTDLLSPFRNFMFILLASSLLVLSLGCQPEKKEKMKKTADKKVANHVEIISEGMNFQMVDTISSGWNNFYYVNNSNDTHFFLIDKYPEGRSIHDLENVIAPIFQNGMDLITKGKPELAGEEFGNLPEWFFQVVFSGGSGLISPKNSCMTTIKLEPGYYILECYVKMPNGKFHTSMGMTKAFIVSNKNSGIDAPEATVNIEISSTNGINYEESIKKGSNVFSVFFKDQIVHENFVGHDVHLVKVEEGANLETLEKWINWADPQGLISPAPEGFTFLGGINDLPAGGKGFFKADLDSGNYVLISEVPNTSKKNMLKQFSIPN